MKRTPLRRSSRLRPASRRRQAGTRAWNLVYAQVDARSGGQCEVVLLRFRCPSRATEHHHLFKPRASHHHADWIVHICRACHRRVDAPYRRGKLMLELYRAGGFPGEIIVASDKRAVPRG